MLRTHRTSPLRVPPRALVALVALALLAPAMGCGGDSSATANSGPAVCDDSAEDSGARACAIVFGVVRGPNDERLAGVRGELRALPGCDCRTPAFDVDDAGTFSTTVRRYANGGTAFATDSGAALIIVRAVDARYPRHPTGGFYFDSATVTLHFGAIGGPIPPPSEVNFRIPLP
jgi:hypothetical protein